MKISDLLKPSLIKLDLQSLDKEDLFDQVAAPAVKQLNTWMQKHAARYAEMADSSRELIWQDSWIDMMRDVVYPRMEDYYLLTARSRGTKYENFLHDLTTEAQKQFLAYFPHYFPQYHLS